MNKSTRGFHLVELLLVVAFVGVIGLVAVIFFNAKHKNDTAQQSTVPAVQTIKTSADLKTADSELQAMSFDDDSSVSTASSGF